MQKISLLGIGLMGRPMALTLKKNNYDVTIFNRSQDKIADLANENIKIAQSVKAAVFIAEIIILMLSDSKAIEAVLLDNDIDFKGKTIIQMATIAPLESQNLSKKLSAQGASYVEAPVLGSIPEAKKGSLIIMLGGSESQYQYCLPVLSCLGNVIYIGEVGQGAAVKLAMNQLIAALTSAFALSLGLVQHYGVDIEKFMQIVRDSALYAPTFDKKLSRMLGYNFENPNFPTKHLAKDVDLFLNVCKDTPLNPSALAGIKIVIDQALAQGLINTDYSAIYQAISPKND